jgi:hypothetical protein
MTKATTTKAQDIKTWVDGYNELVANHEAKITRLNASHEDNKAQYVYKMSGMTKLSNTEIANALGIKSDYVGKLITRGALVAFGFDGQTGARLVKETGNGITVASIAEIVESDGTKADKVEALAELGLVTQESAKRKADAGRPKRTIEERTNADLIELARIVNRAVQGDTTTSVIWEALCNATENQAFKGLFN